MLRHGWIVRLREGALRDVEGRGRPEAVPCDPGIGAWWNRRGPWVLLPPTGPAFHRRDGGLRGRVGGKADEVGPLTLPDQLQEPAPLFPFELPPPQGTD